MKRPLIPLPIDPYVPEIIEAVKNNSVVIVDGSPGSGKSTRLMPAFLSGLSTDWSIFQTQPRPMLVRSSAQRMLDEHMAEEWRPGSPVGYIAGADRYVFPHTRGIVLTDQALVNRLSEISLDFPTVVIVDEAHLRSTQNGVLLGMLNILLKIHPDTLRIVISSATAWVEEMVEFFGGAVVIKVTGRRFSTSRRIVPCQDAVLSLGARIVESVGDFLGGQYTVEGREISRILVIHGAVAAVVPGEEDVEGVADRIANRLLDGEGAVSESIPGGESFRVGEKTVEILKDYRAFEDRIDAEERMRSDVPENCLRIIVGTEIVRTGVTIKNLVEFHDAGLVKRFVDDKGAGKLELQLVTKAEVVQAEGRLGRVCPGRYTLYLPLNKALADLADHPESELRRQPLTRTVLSIRSAGYDPHSFPLIERIHERIEPGLPTFAERLEQADRRLAALGAVSANGAVTLVGERLRSMRARPEVVVAVWRGIECDIGGETLLASIASEPNCTPFFHTKKDRKNVPFTTTADVVRLVLSRCELMDDTGGVRAYYMRDSEVTPPHEVDLDRLPPWITRSENDRYVIQFVGEEGYDYLTNRGRHEISLLIRRSYARGTGSDFVAIVNACRAFAAFRNELKEGADEEEVGMTAREREETAHRRRHKLREWCEQRFLNFSNLQLIWRRVNETLVDLKRAGQEIPGDITATREFSSAALTQALIPLFEKQVGVLKGQLDTYVAGQHIVEPGWQSAMREFYPLPPLALFAEIRQGERRGETHNFADFAAPLSIEWLVKSNPARWQMIVRGSKIVGSAVAEDVALFDAERQQELCRFKRPPSQSP